MDFGFYAEMGTHRGFQLRKDVTYLSFKKIPPSLMLTMQAGPGVVWTAVGALYRVVLWVL